MISEQAFTQMAAEELTARGIAFTPSEQEAAHLGVPHVAPAASAPAAPPTPAATPKALTPDEMYAQLTAPDEGLSVVAAGAMAPPQAGAGDYKIDLPLGATITPEIEGELNEARDSMRAVGLPGVIGQWAAAEVIKGLQNPPTDQERDYARDAGLRELRTTWKQDFARNLGEVRAVVKTLPANVVAALERSGLANSPALARHILNAVQAKRR